MRKIEMIAVVLLMVVFTGITRVNAQGGFDSVNTPKTNINTGLSQLTAAIDQKADKYMLSEATGNMKGEFDELVSGVRTDIENASKKSDLEFGKIVVPVVQVYEKRMMSVAPQIIDCLKSTWPTENCVIAILNYDKNKAVRTALVLAMIDHYLGDSMKELGPGGDNNSVRKLIEQELGSKRIPVK